MSTERIDRVLDCTLGSLLLLLMVPVMVFCATLVLITSGTPVLFRQKRIGKNEVPFEIFKFRSMTHNADQIKWPPENPEGTPVTRRLRKDDPRITFAGRLLRRWALDELPQLLNVLRGDMSLVGPRPLPGDEWRRLDPLQRQQLIPYRPGMTGPYQVAVRLGCSFEDAQHSEFDYLQRHNMLAYIKVLFATPLSLIRGGGDLRRLPPERAVTHSLPLAKPRTDNERTLPEMETFRDIQCLQILGRTLLFDPITIKAFAIDETATCMFKRVQSARSNVDPRNLPAPDSEAWNELSMLGRGLAKVRASIPQVAGIDRSNECRLMLEITRTCTLQCTYCYTVNPSRRSGLPEHMSWEVATAAVELLVRLAKAWDCRGFLNFTGGEPILRFDFLKQLVEYTTLIAQRHNIDLRCSFGITNGTVAPSGLVEFLQQTGHVISISLDGPAVMHDANRRFPDGQNSHAKAVAIAQHLLGAGVAKSAGATLTANNLQVREILEYLVNVGFERVVIKPARLPKDHPLALTEDTLQLVLDRYCELAIFLVDSARKGHLAYLSATLNPLDFFGRFLIRTLLGLRVEYRCPAARSSFGVNTDGGLYPCSSFCDISQFQVGSVFTDINWMQCHDFLAPPVQEKRGCNQCWARHLCGGGCAYAAYATNGSVLEPDDAKCRLIRHLCTLSLWLWAELAEKNPKAIMEVRKHLSRAGDRLGIAQAILQTAERMNNGDEYRH